MLAVNTKDRDSLMLETWESCVLQLCVSLRERTINRREKWDIAGGSSESCDLCVELVGDGRESSERCRRPIRATAA